MINYYYEIPPDVQVLGHSLRYLAQFDVHPDGPIHRRFHDEAYYHATRVWAENANGVNLIKVRDKDERRVVFDAREFAWVKLMCRDVETL